jgi:hypothetical protein
MNQILDFLGRIDPVMGAFLATTFTWIVTAAGAGLVFFFGNASRKWLDGMLGFTGGVMVAASFWSLLTPSIEISERLGNIPWLAPAIGFAAGALFLFAYWIRCCRTCTSTSIPAAAKGRTPTGTGPPCSCWPSRCTTSPKA